MTDAGVRAFEMVAALDYERTAGSPQEAGRLVPLCRHFIPSAFLLIRRRSKFPFTKLPGPLFL